MSEKSGDPSSDTVSNEMASGHGDRRGADRSECPSGLCRHF